MHPLERRARRAWLEWLKTQANWTWFVTLTFARDVSEVTANKALRWWFHRLASEAVQDHFRIAWVSGRQVLGRLHFHVFVEIPPKYIAPLDLEWANVVWRASPFPTGEIKAEVYDPSGNAIAYSVTGHDSVEFTLACPRTGRCKHRRCRYAPPL